ncbi:MAG: glycoside hydrolase family 3 C-terminal domain-containing protein [Lachnospiraceae bacterium]|nr:glycoside hydrolase family 3 C-terminal domain-containing protein [Lachnospiraceae bacterium]
MTLKELIGQMTVAEKARFMEGVNAWETPALERLGIPSIRVADGPHGVRKQNDTEDTTPEAAGTVTSVCFPSASALAASFNRGVFATLGETLAKECKALDVDMILGPAINIKRSPLCGRNFEYVSEDPYLTGELATAYVKGVQRHNVGVSVKHFAANNQEKRRMTISAVIDERTLREIYLSAFEAVVKGADPDSLMCSYNGINGVFSSQNKKLLTDILRNEWGYKGFVMSDWGAVHERPLGVAAGLDLGMPSSGGKDAKDVEEAVNNGTLDEALLDTAVANILKKVDKYKKIPLLHEEETPAEEDKSKVKPQFNRSDDHKIARKIASECMVLLKNEGMLPLSTSEKIVFIGEYARKPRFQGAGSSHITSFRVSSPLAAARHFADVRYKKGFGVDDEKLDEKLADEAVLAARKASVAVIFAGLPDEYESEGFDRDGLNLPEAQNELIARICKVQPNTVVCIQNGSPVTMPWINDVNGVLECYLAGEAGGEACAKILFGKVNPSGKLAETFPLRLSDTPCRENFPGRAKTVEYREAIFVGYRYYDKVSMNVLFPFGHGLSYTTFSYSDLRINHKVDEVEVNFKIKNSGSCSGAEVAQVYVGKPVGQVHRAVRELKGFEKIYLEPGEEREITITLDKRAFSYYSAGEGDWVVEPGSYHISVGSSSRDLRLRGVVTLDTSGGSVKLHKADELPTYFFGDPAVVSDEEFATLLCAPIPEADYKPGEKFTLYNSLEDVKHTRFGKVFYRIAKLACKGHTLLGSKKMFETNVLETQMRNYFAWSNGRVTEDTAKALLGLFNNEDIEKNLKIVAAAGIDLVKGRFTGKK